MYNSVALVLEGGGMRGAYSAGVLDVLHDNHLKFGGYAGTSAGATHLCSFISEQRERNYRIDIIHSKDKRYMGWNNLLHSGNFFDVEFCYHTIPEILDLFDNETFKKNTEHSDFYACVTNVSTGKAEYISLKDLANQDDLNFVRASASLPLFSQIVEIQGEKYLDGGICDSIPFEIMNTKGFEKQVVILTRPLGYQKEPNTLLPLFKIVYRDYPDFVKAVGERHIHYNASLATLQEWEKQGKSFVFRPSEKMDISRIETNTEKLIALYNLGVKDAQEQIPLLMQFLEK